MNSVDAGGDAAFPEWLPLSTRQRVSASQGVLIWGEMSDASCAAVALLRMDWDCNHFGSTIGEIIIEMHGKRGAEIVSHILPEIVKWACLEGWRHISVHVDSDNALLAEIIGRSGFWVADTKMVYRRDYDARESFPRLLFSPREMVTADLDKVRKIVSQAEFPSRFSRDEFFDRHRVTDMHLSWLENIIRRPSFDQIACVAVSGDKVMAFAIAESVSRDGGEQSWSGYSRALAAGERNACGAALSAVGEMTSTARKRGSNIECVVSAHNSAAVRGLTYLGYHIFKKQWVFHRHITGDSSSSGLVACRGLA